jgi:imidazole glycerol-phosphate synthase subunit HisH
MGPVFVLWKPRDRALSMLNIIDYGSGNLRSVSKALEHLGVSNRVSREPRDVETADRVILPGVGAFGACVDGVRRGGFEPAIYDFVKSGRPFLGICVGMQIIAESSDETPGSRGLGLIRGHCPRFSRAAKVPHMGWNDLPRRRPGSRLLAGIPEDAYFYFVHSYFVRPSAEDESNVVGGSDYEEPFAAVFERENVYATQFHPEKSQQWGLKLLENFSRL